MSPLEEKVYGKKIYITPYNDSAKILKRQLDTIKEYTFLGYIDKNIREKDVFSIKTITEYDYILVVSENYSYNIFSRLIQNGYNKDKVLHVSYKSVNNFVLNPLKLRLEELSNRIKITFFGNCQARHLCKVFTQSLDYNKYEIKYFSNYDNSSQNHEILETIQTSDILIYQPLSKKHGELSAENIRAIAKKETTLISFPYIYNDGLYSLEYNGKKTIGEEAIIELYKKGHTLEEIIGLYRTHKIEFGLLKRFQDSLENLNNREVCTDIKIARFIEKNYQKKKLFMSASHPTNHIYNELLDQLNTLLNLEVKLHTNLHITHPQSTLVPVSPYDIFTHNFRFNCETEGQWDIHGIAIITIVINNYKLRANSLKVPCQ